jgi:hypothetical protein
VSGQRLERYGNVFRIPPGPGRAIVSTDLHGNLEDYHRVVAAWQRAIAREDAYLILTGDLVHGPIYEKNRWPDHLGDYYPDQSVELLEEFAELQRQHPDRVVALLGNHEHSHIGGPHTRKFHKDPSETQFFEGSLGPERTQDARTLFRSFPLCGVVGRGVVVTHGAPRVLDATFAEVCQTAYDGHSEKTIPQMLEVPILGELFWTRIAGSIVVRRFLKRMSLGGQPNRIVIYGHDPVRQGWAREGLEQLCFSTSFALKNARKVYVELDLDREYRTVEDLKLGRDIRWLYPELSLARKKKNLVTG